MSAPASLASRIWYSSKINSLRRIAGRFSMLFRACRTARKSSMLPLNHSGSVRTEMTLAPASILPGLGRSINIQGKNAFRRRRSLDLGQ